MANNFEDFSDMESEIDEVITDSGDLFKADPDDFSFTSEEKEKMRLQARGLVNTISESFVSLGGVLYKVFGSKSYIDYGFETFDEYCELDVGFKGRKCKYLISIWNAMENKLTDEDQKKRLKDMGWTKASRVAPYIDDNNAEEILKETEGMSVSEVEEAMSVHRGKRNRNKNQGEGDEEKPEIRQVSLDMIESHYRNLKEAMDLAGDITGSQSRSQQLDLLATEFLSSHSSAGTAKGELIETHVRALKSLTGSEYEPSGAGDIMKTLIDATIEDPEKMREKISSPGAGEVLLREFREFLDSKDLSPLFTKPAVNEFSEEDENV